MFMVGRGYLGRSRVGGWVGPCLTHSWLVGPQLTGDRTVAFFFDPPLGHYTVAGGWDRMSDTKFRHAEPVPGLK